MIKSPYIEKCKTLLAQFFKYSIVGVSNTLLTLAAYYMLILLGLHYLAANTAGFLVGALNSYYWNNRYVFKKTACRHNIIKAYICSGLMYLLSSLFLSLMVESFSISEYIAPIINAVLIVGVGFLINKFWVFK